MIPHVAYITQQWKYALATAIWSNCVDELATYIDCRKIYSYLAFQFELHVDRRNSRNAYIKI